MNKEKYPNGKCEWCGKIFERPNKWRTETEAIHTYECRLDGIENAISNKEDLGDINGLIDEIKRIFKISSFGAGHKPNENEYNRRMERCDKIFKKLENLKK